MKKIFIFSSLLFLFIFSSFISVNIKATTNLNNIVLSNPDVYDDKIIMELNIIIDNDIIVRSDGRFQLLYWNLEEVLQDDYFIVDLGKDYRILILDTNKQFFRLWDYTDQLIFKWVVGQPGYVLMADGQFENNKISGSDYYFYLVIEAEDDIESMLFEEYMRGYTQGKNDFYDSRYNSGYNDAINELEEGNIIYDDIFNNGRSKGRQEIINEQGGLRMQIIDFLPGVLGSIFLFFLTVSQIGFFGITILDLLGLAFMVGALVFVIRFFFKG